MKLSTQPYKGARDFYPEDQRVQRYIFDIWKRVAERFGYEEYNAPILELSEIYRAKSGEELVNQQTYTFTDRGGREVSIRPEMTPTVSRMVAGRRQELAYPLRWYSIPNLWRYERPQRGRLREHWQLNVDVFGVSTIDAEMEVILIADDIMREFGAKDEMFTVKLNSRKLTSLIMANFLNLDPAQSHLVVKLLDQKDKLPEDAFDAQAKQLLVDNEDGFKKLKLLTKATSLGDLPKSILESAPVRQLQLLYTHLKESHLENVTIDMSLMRGFDYYTDIVFEVYDNNPENNRSMFGGGRYDGLVGLFGVEPVPTVGFGMGDVTMLNFLEGHKLMPELGSETDVYLAVIGDHLRQAQGLARLMRASGVNVAVDLSQKKMGDQIKTAVKKGIKFAMFVGEEELSSEKFPLKDLDTKQEEKMPLDQVINKVLESKKAKNQ